jgi:hypothetical protein
MQAMSFHDSYGRTLSSPEGWEVREPTRGSFKGPQSSRPHQFRTSALIVSPSVLPQGTVGCVARTYCGRR